MLLSVTKIMLLLHYYYICCNRIKLLIIADKSVLNVIDTLYLSKSDAENCELCPPLVLVFFILFVLFVQRKQ